MPHLSSSFISSLHLSSTFYFLFFTFCLFFYYSRLLFSSLLTLFSFSSFLVSSPPPLIFLSPFSIVLFFSFLAWSGQHRVWPMRRCGDFVLGWIPPDVIFTWRGPFGWTLVLCWLTYSLLVGYCAVIFFLVFFFGVTFMIVKLWREVQ